MNFLGYRRPDGKVGVRNKIFILPASVCASDTTRIIASQIEGAVTFNNQNGCSQVAGDQQLTDRYQQCSSRCGCAAAGRKYPSVRNQ